MLVGYADNHSGDCYKMLNMNTKCIMVTHNVLWLKQPYFGKDNAEVTPIVDVVDDDDDGDDIMDAIPSIDHDYGAPTTPSLTPGGEDEYVANDDEYIANSNSNESEHDKDKNIDDDANGNEPEQEEPNMETDDNSDSDESDNQEEKETQQTQSGKTVRMTTYLIEEMEALLVNKDRVKQIAWEVALVGAGIGGGFVHTSELIPMKFEEAM